MLEVEIEYANSSWFAYTSTTAVSLGDYYLNHSVFLIGYNLLVSIYVWPRPTFFFPYQGGYVPGKFLPRLVLI